MKVTKLTLDLSMYLPEWMGMECYSCPVLVIPSAWASVLEYGIINDKKTVVRAKIDNVWFPVYAVNHGRIGEYRVPNGYPETKIEKIMTTAEMSSLIWNIVQKGKML